jgi:hypothetical protein
MKASVESLLRSKCYWFSRFLHFINHEKLRRLSGGFFFYSYYIEQDREDKSDQFIFPLHCPCPFSWSADRDGTIAIDEVLIESKYLQYTYFLQKKTRKLKSETPIEINYSLLLIFNSPTDDIKGFGFYSNG